jgi:transposase
MPPHLSLEMRQRIVEWHYEQHKVTGEIARLAGCSERTVYNILRLHREFGQVTNPYAHPRGRPRALDMRAMNFISSILDAQPVLYLDEIQERLLDTLDIDVSIATISRAMRRLAFTHKNVAAAALERNEELRNAWIARNGDLQMEYIVWLDEAGIDNYTNQRGQGWAKLGQACVRRAAFIRGERFSILPALTCDGIIALDILEGSVNKEKFLHFLRRDLVCSAFSDEDIYLTDNNALGSKANTLPWSS